MKAFLLAAGKGTRLRPLTLETPKCLVTVAGRPLLDTWLDLLGSHGVTDVLINTHHLAEKVERHVRENPVPGVEVTLVHEPELLGSAGTVSANRAFVAGEESFFVLYADNFTNIDLTDFRDFHASRISPFTMGLFETSEPSECGIATLDDEGRVIAFEEKPAHPVTNLANGGSYVAGSELFDWMPDQPFADFGYDILPKLIGRMYGYRIKGYVRDIGSLERLDEANREWAATEGPLHPEE